MTAERGVKWLLRFLSITTIPAFFAAVMLQSWLVDLFRWAEPEFSPGLLVAYLIRCLMAFWIIFVDLTEGLAYLTLLAILTFRVPAHTP